MSATCNEGANPLWFYSPFLFRDRKNSPPASAIPSLSPGSPTGLRRALLDETTITEGVEYERYVAEWLALKSGQDPPRRPQLTVWISGGASHRRPGDVASEYQIRVPVTSVEEMHIQTKSIYMLIGGFGLTPNPLRSSLRSERVSKIVPQAGDETTPSSGLGPYHRPDPSCLRRAFPGLDSSALRNDAERSPAVSMRNRRLYRRVRTGRIPFRCPFPKSGA